MMTMSAEWRIANELRGLFGAGAAAEAESRAEQCHRTHDHLGYKRWHRVADIVRRMALQEHVFRFVPLDGA